MIGYAFCYKVKQLMPQLTIGWEEVPIEDSDTEGVHLDVADGELHGGVPARVQSLTDHLGLVLLGPHTHLAVRVTLTWGRGGHRLDGGIRDYNIGLLVNWIFLKMEWS